MTIAGHELFNWQAATRSLHKIKTKGPFQIQRSEIAVDV